MNCVKILPLTVVSPCGSGPHRVEEENIVATTVLSALTEADTWDDERLVGQLFNIATGRHAARNVFAFGDDGQAPGEQASSEALNEQLKQFIRENHVGAVTYFPPGGRYESLPAIRATIRELQDVADVPLLVATDQENGTVARVRVGVPQLPGAMALGATADAELWRLSGAYTADQLLAAGVQQAFAPVADVNTRSANPGVNIRSAGADPVAAAAQVATVVRALGEKGVAATLKHFPGLGRAAVDSHNELPIVSIARDAWDAVERLPFEAGIDAGADSIMLGHVVFPALDEKNPATFSRAIVQGLLRAELGFDGVVVTDAMDMGGAAHPDGAGEACVAALDAGVDQILMPADFPEAYDAVLAAVKDGRLSRERLRESAKRILRLKQKRSVGTLDLAAAATVDTAVQERFVQRSAARAIAVRDDAAPATLQPGAHILLLHPGNDPYRRGADTGGVIRTVLETAGHTVTAAPWGGDADALAAAVTSDATQAVVVLRDAFKSGLPVTELLESLTASGLDVFVIASRSPYDGASVPSAYPLVLSYGDDAPSLTAAAHVLTGAAEALGGRPMPVPSLESARRKG
ncbi:glycoside hydrolase family 3 protein [Agromyces archimandritae]|uniref:Glycoside hydrolase family 3 N-terminal domain-containing protein n=1 Tax=Agromyces archimandritae TaxID=2781962 RepID=A0A975FK92_9MICO|nr:glycoside hydrolase family 3 N-terminal domain-containing protein [Agromyces archimandritae]QTX04080.1 hypothetical protein G127AT_12365 [Agromyces archimandritae]